MYKSIFTILTLTLSLGAAHAQINTLTLDQFTVERFAAEGCKSNCFNLTLNKGDAEITIKLFHPKPTQIITSYFDEQYLVLVYKGKGHSHYLAGAYHDGEEWIEDYFQRPLGFATGLSYEAVKTARFIDEASLLLEYEVFSHVGGGQYSTKHTILRICRDQIYEFKRVPPSWPNRHGIRNSLRPEH